MNRPEAARLLTIITAYDRRTLGDTDVYAWQRALDDLPLADAEEAVHEHYRESKEWLMPSDVRNGVIRIQRARRGRIRVAENLAILAAEGVTPEEAEPPARPTVAWTELGKELEKRAQVGFKSVDAS